ncbi:MAG: hypothetical protein AAB969_01805 [Patescibacteria group bacterium]
MGIAITFSFMLLILVAVVSTWAAKITIKNLPMKQLEGKELGRPLGSPVKHRHFYAEIQNYVGGYLQVTIRGDSSIIEEIGEIKSIQIITNNGKDELIIQCTWTLERDFSMDSQWRPIPYSSSYSYDCFNVLHDAHIYNLETSAIHNFGSGCSLIIPGGSRLFMLIPANDKEVGHQISWEKFKQLKQLG